MVTDASSGTVNVQATKALKQQVISELLPLPFVGPALADIVRLHAANPTNDFPCIKRGLQTHNGYPPSVLYRVCATLLAPGGHKPRKKSTAWLAWSVPGTRAPPSQVYFVIDGETMEVSTEGSGSHTPQNRGKPQSHLLFPLERSSPWRSKMFMRFIAENM